MPARLSEGVPNPLIGSDLSEVIKHAPYIGDDGNDVMNSDGGNDVFIGNGGDDLLRGGEGVDTYFGGPGFDRVSFFLEAQAPEGVYASLATQTVYDDGFGHTEQMDSIEGLGAGTLHADTLIGSDGPNWMVGGLGDIILAGGSDDVVVMYDAPALIDGGSGVNTIVLNGQREVYPGPDIRPQGVEDATRGVVIDLGKGLVVDDGFGNSGVVVNIQNVYGSQLGDVIIGDGQDNVLMGLGGDDTLTGGGGNDVFIFNALATDNQGDPISNGHDLITDFHHGHDKIDIDMPGVASFADLTISQPGSGDVVITYGPNGDTITLAGVHHVTAQDFIFGPIG